MALAMATTGIAAMLLEKGRTFHSRMKAPLNPDDTSTLRIPGQTGEDGQGAGHRQGYNVGQQTTGGPGSNSTGRDDMSRTVWRQDRGVGWRHEAMPCSCAWCFKGWYR